MEAEESWQIRTAAAVDLETVLELWREAGVPAGATDTKRGLERLLDRDRESLLLATPAEGAIVGTLIVAWDGWRGSFYRLVVAPGWRRRGAATALVRAGERRLAELGAVRLTALLTSDGPAAASLWGSLGYRSQPGVSRFVKE
jgi:ribosomal protein S18 acetylase RimI-like enzyme